MNNNVYVIGRIQVLNSPNGWRPSYVAASALMLLF
jgi:hypothetical protein